MRNFIFLLGIIILLGNGLTRADEAPPLVTTDQERWTLKPEDPFLVIDNPTGNQLFIRIHVDKGNNVGGIDVYNCGDGIIHLDPGSATTCDNTDPNSPVKFEADTSEKTASGTYFIDQR